MYFKVPFARMRAAFTVWLLSALPAAAEMQRVHCNGFHVHVDAYRTDIQPARDGIEACVAACEAHSLCESIAFRDYGGSGSDCIGFACEACDPDAPSDHGALVFHWDNLQVWQARAPKL